MAGDVQVGEALITERSPQGVAQSPLLHEYGARLSIRLTDCNGEKGGTMTAAPINFEALSAAERLGSDALVLLHSDDYIAAKTARPHAGESWDRGVDRAPQTQHPGRSAGPSSTGALSGVPTPPSRLAPAIRA